MVPNVIERVWVQGTTTKVESLRGTAFTEEDGAHTFRIAGVDASGETVPLSGTVLAKILRADNITIDVSGTITDGVASVTMVGDCYHVPGRFSIVVYLSDGVTTIAIYAAVGDIYRATSDTELDSGTTVPSLVQLEAAYQNALSATAAANTAATGAERVNVSMSKSGDTITFSATDRTGATTTATMSDQSEEVADLESDVTDLENNVANLNSAIDVYPRIYHEISVIVTSDMLELGRINDSGVPVSHNSRCRTRNFIPVSAGDTILIRYKSGSNAFIVSYYDTTKTFISNSAWIYFNNKKSVTIAQNGYIKLTFDAATTDTFDSLVQVSRTAKATAETISFEAKTQQTILPIPKESYVYGYWLEDGTNRVGSNRLMNYKPISVNTGDEICFTAKTSILVDIGFQKKGTSTITFDDYGNMPFKAPADGYIYLNYKNDDGTTISDFTPLDNAITVVKASEIGLVENASESKLMNGYVNSSGAISTHNSRLVNWRPIHANAGDIVRLNYLDVCMYVYEFDRAKTLLADSVGYYYPLYVGGNYQLSGDYIVQNDSWIMCTISPSGSTPASFKPSDYPDVFSVIHIANRNINTAENTYFRFPKSARKGERLETSAIASQGITFVDGDMWSAVDSTTDYINIIDVSTGEIKRTITHDIGHCNSLDYCKETDCIITTTANGVIENPKIIIIPNVSAITDSISLNDCLQITVDPTEIDLVATICFGEDKHEAWIYTGKGSSNPYDLYKIVLEYDEGEYTGNIISYTKYTGVIRDNIDTYVLTGMSRYAQDCCYDGYLYLGYGTAGHNFLVIDIDEIHKTYCVVGNFLHKMYDDDYVEFGVEPEGVAIFNGNLYCSSRSVSRDLSFFMRFSM